MKVTILDENAIHDIGHAFGCYDYGQDVRPHPIPRCGETVTGKKKAKDNMKITIIAALMIFLAYFLILYGGVGFIQDKRFFSSAPKENLAAIPDRKERFPGAHAVGWVIEGIAILLFLGAAALSVWDGVRNDFGFLRFFVRFLGMLYAMEIYDILFFDWVLLCHSGFFPHFYPELKDVVGPHMFGYNKRTHILHFVIYLPACAAAAWLCTLL